MKGIVQLEFGSPAEVLELRELDTPRIEKDAVLVRVRAASIHVGEVYGTAQGAFAEYAVTKEDALAAKPEGLTFEQAAAIGVSATTALQALRDHGKVQAGQRVLITGASGGVGTLAVQIAALLGATVTGVCSARNMDTVRSIGADHAIDFTQDAPHAGVCRCRGVPPLATSAAQWYREGDPWNLGGGVTMNETQNPGPAPPPPTPDGTRSSGVAAAALSLAALIAAWFAVTVAYTLAWNYDGWDYLAAGGTLGAIAALLLWGAVLQTHHVVTGQLPTGTTMLTIALVCFLLLLAAVVVAGEYGRSQSILTMV